MTSPSSGPNGAGRLFAKLNPKHTQSLTRLGQLYAIEKGFPEAIDVLQQALEGDGRATGHALTDAMRFWERFTWKPATSSAAQTAFAQAVKLDPKNGSYRRDLKRVSLPVAPPPRPAN